MISKYDEGDELYTDTSFGFKKCVIKSVRVSYEVCVVGANKWHEVPQSNLYTRKEAEAHIKKLANDEVGRLDT